MVERLYRALVWFRYFREEIRLRNDAWEAYQNGYDQRARTFERFANTLRTANDISER